MPRPIAQDWIRTSTSLSPLAPQASASAKFRHLGDYGIILYDTGGPARLFWLREKIRNFSKNTKF